MDHKRPRYRLFQSLYFFRFLSLNMRFSKVGGRNLSKLFINNTRHDPYVSTHLLPETIGLAKLSPLIGLVSSIHYSQYSSTGK